MDRMKNTLINVDGSRRTIYAINASRHLYSVSVSERNNPAYAVVLGEVLGNFEAEKKQ